MTDDVPRDLSHADQTVAGTLNSLFDRHAVGNLFDLDDAAPYVDYDSRIRLHLLNCLLDLFCTAAAVDVIDLEPSRHV